MSERPVRWLEDERAGARERELLRAAGSGEPPAGAEDRVWAALVGRLPPDPSGGGGDGGVGAATGALGALKAGGIGALIGLVVATGATIAEPEPTPVRPTPSAVGVTTVIAPPARVVPREPPPEPELVAPPSKTTRAPSRPAPAVESAPSPASIGALGPAEHETQLREESQALQAVRRALRTGDAAGALATLEATRARFPASVLGQEREALTIQALAQSGQRDVARSRARAFIAKFPTSPHAASLERFTEREPTK